MDGTLRDALKKAYEDQYSGYDNVKRAARALYSNLEKLVQFAPHIDVKNPSFALYMPTLRLFPLQTDDHSKDACFTLDAYSLGGLSKEKPYDTSSLAFVIRAESQEDGKSALVLSVTETAPSGEFKRTLFSGDRLNDHVVYDFVSGRVLDVLGPTYGRALLNNLEGKAPAAPAIG